MADEKKEKAGAKAPAPKGEPKAPKAPDAIVLRNPNVGGNYSVAVDVQVGYFEGYPQHEHFEFDVKNGRIEVPTSDKFANQVRDHFVTKEKWIDETRYAAKPEPEAPAPTRKVKHYRLRHPDASEKHPINQTVDVLVGFKKVKGVEVEEYETVTVQDNVAIVTNKIVRDKLVAERWGEGPVAYEGEE